MRVLFLVIFVDLIGFGLLLPLLPFYVQRTGASVEMITLVLGLYSLGQFVSAPIWGRLSDTYGRKPILVITSLGLALSYAALSFADSLPLLIASRVFGGLMAGNIGAAQAYVSDITTPETRAKGMGMLGAAFGLGFIFGPALGGMLSGADLATANFFRPAIAAAALTVIATVGAQIFLKESLPAEIRAAIRHHNADVPFNVRLRVTFARATLIMLIIAGFLTVTGWAQFEAVFALWANRVLNYGPKDIGLVLTFIAVVMVIVQGGAIGPLTRKFGEQRIAGGSVILMIAGYLLMVHAATLEQTLIACGVLAAGFGLFNPSLPSLVSKEAADHERGMVLGTYQGLTSLSRAIGPAFAGVAFAHLGTGAPFLVGLGLMVPALILLLLLPPVRSGDATVPASPL